MSISYGTITITDTTDLGQLSVYLTGSTVRQQVYDAGANPPTTATYYPDWSTNGNALIITPHVYFNGKSENLNSSKIEVSWSKEENGVTYPNGTVTSFPTSPTTAECPESATDSASGYKKLQRPTNLAINSSGATYTATITYYPIDGDRNTKLQGIATLDLTIANNGEKGADGQPGAAAKTLQLIGSGSHFTYTWDGTATGNTSIILSVEKSSTVAGVHWYCDGTLITTEGTAYTGLNLEITPSNIGSYSSGYAADKSAQFQIVETNSTGTEVSGGLVDYFTIYKLQDAQPGSSTYSAYLDNDQETVNEYNGTIDFTNATTIFHLDKGGQNDLVANSGWTISISDSGDITYTVGKSSFNTLPSGNNNEITAVTAMTGDTAWIQFTAQNTDTRIANQTKRFTIQKNPSLISHALRLDSVVSNRDVNSFTYTPASIVADAIVRTGGGTDSYRVANAITATITYEDNSTVTVSNTNNQPCSISLADKISGNNRSKIKNIVVNLTYNNETVDTQTIAITSNGTDGQDGNDGESPWNFILSNQFDAISTDFTYDASEDFEIKLPITAAEGTVLKTIYRGGQTYPTIDAPTILTNITPKYYLGNTQITSGMVDNIRYTIPANKNIGETGAITLTLTYAAGKTLTQTYTYKAQPEALKPIRVMLDAAPSDTFENQEGTITITPIVLSGTETVTTGLSYPEGGPWKVYVDGVWKTISAAAISGISVNNTTKVISVNGNAVNGYLGFSYTVEVSKGGIVEEHTEYINLKDIDDPLQVSLHSTVGEQIVNSQGVGVIYARVIRRGDQEDYDTVVPDNLLAVGTAAPASASGLSGKTGYCHVRVDTNNKPTGQIDYYWRAASGDSWSGPRGNGSNPYRYTYTWTFRNKDNEPYSSSSQDTPTALQYAMTHNQQFVYVNAGVVNNKITAIVKVEL